MHNPDCLAANLVGTRPYARLAQRVEQTIDREQR